MFEALALGVFEVGLSWPIVFGKHEAFRKAIRNHGKIQATVDNARTMVSSSPTIATLAKSYEINRKRLRGRLLTCLTSPHWRRRSRSN
jgi:DNA-3-methyladenine glycosylase I